MRALIVYESFFGATRAVADAVAEGIQAEPLVVVATTPVATAPVELNDIDLLVVGAPTHMLGLSSGVSRWLQAQYWGDPAAPVRSRRPHGRPSSRASLRAWLGQVSWHPTPCAAAFDTRIPGGLSGGATRVIAGRLRRRGLVLLTPPQAFAVRGVTGPLAEGELARATAWGASLVDALIAGRSSGSVPREP